MFLAAGKNRQAPAPDGAPVIEMVSIHADPRHEMFKGRTIAATRHANTGQTWERPPVPCAAAELAYCFGRMQGSDGRSKHFKCDRFADAETSSRCQRCNGKVKTGLVKAAVIFATEDHATTYRQGGIEPRLSVYALIE